MIVTFDIAILNQDRGKEDDPASATNWGTSGPPLYTRSDGFGGAVGHGLLGFEGRSHGLMAPRVHRLTSRFPSSVLELHLKRTQP